MAFTINTSLTPEQNILALIKHTASSKPAVQALNDGDLVFSMITPRDGEDLNTQLTVVAAPAAVGLQGETTINYRRLAPGATVVDPELEFTLAEDATLEDLRAQVAAALGMALDGSDATLVGDLPDAGQTGALQVVANVDSLLYVGEVEIQVVLTKDSLSDHVGGDQDGFDPAG
jgi:hypothetical protein